MQYSDRYIANQLNKFKRSIALYGKVYTFKHYDKDKYGETIGEPTEVSIKGIWHTSNGYTQKTTKEGSQIKSKRTPTILALFEGCEIKEKDILVVNSISYEVNEVANINDYNIIVEISLGVIANG